MILTDARAGIARSSATRSGYPFLEGVLVPLYALSAIARSGATRSNYTGSDLFLTIDGVPIPIGGDEKVLYAGASIVDTLDETPSTGTLTTYGTLAGVGDDVAIGIGSRNNLRKIFAGTVLATTRRYQGKPAHGFDDLRLIDYTWQLSKYLIRTRYQSATVASIVASLVATYAPGYTASVAADIGAYVIDEITFTETTLPDCLTQITRRAGGAWLCDFTKTIRVFYDASAFMTPPRPLNAVHPSLYAIDVARDLSQVVTRAYVEGGGANCAALVPAGETIVPLDGDPSWYLPTGGVVVTGAQRLTYTGVSVSAGGGMVGPGAAPSGAPLAQPTPGSGIETGIHKYAVTFQTAAGESIAGPAVTIGVGPIDAPATAPVVGVPQGGTGPERGTHLYAVSFVTASGETVPGPLASAVDGYCPPPTIAPSMIDPPTSASPGVDAGLHEYAVAFVNPAGETPAGPISPAMSTGYVPPPPPLAAVTAAGFGLGLGLYYYAYTFVFPGGETQASTPVAMNVTGVPPVATPPTPSAAPSTTSTSSIWNPGDSLYFATSYQDNLGVELSIRSPVSGTIIALSAGAGMAYGATVNVTRSSDPRVFQIRIYINRNGVWTGAYLATPNTTFAAFVGSSPNAGYPPTQWAAGALSNIATGPPGTTARRLYRTTVNAPAAWTGYIATIANNTATTYTDTAPDGAVGAAPPTSSTVLIPSAAMPLINLQTGPPGTTGRKLYRRSGGVPDLRLVMLINNNGSTTYTDTTPNASLGAPPPSSNTAVTPAIPLTAIPLGAPLVTSRKLYRTVVSGSQLKLLTTLFDNTTTEYLDTRADGTLGANAPTVTTATANRVQLSAIPIGAAAVTARKLYRTAANQSQLKLLTTLADNTTTTYLDSASLAVLGANVPILDNSGLKQPEGSVNPGATTIQVANIGPFPASGWAVIGNGSQVVRYTGISGNVLTGIPASGPGSIVAAIAFNSTATAAPALLGVTGIRDAILDGDAITIWVQVDDVPAQAALAATLGGDGVQEHTIQDRRLSAREAAARGRAVLDLRRDVTVEIRFRTRDINTRAGAMIDVNLGAPFFLIASFRIQQVSIDFAPTRPPLFPTHSATASSVRYSFEDFLRAIKNKAS